MDLFTRLQNQGSLSFFGKQPAILQSTPIPPGTIHNTFSIDGNPTNTLMVGINGVYKLPTPSILDLGTLNPSKYMNNPPR